MRPSPVTSVPAYASLALLGALLTACTTADPVSDPRAAPPTVPAVGASTAPSPRPTPAAAATRRVALAGVSLVVPDTWTTVHGPCVVAKEPGSVVVEGVSSSFTDCVTQQTTAPSVTIDSRRRLLRFRTRLVDGAEVRLSRLSCSTSGGTVTCRQEVADGRAVPGGVSRGEGGVLAVRAHGEPGQRATARQQVRRLVGTVAPLGRDEAAVPVVDVFGDGLAGPGPEAPRATTRLALGRAGLVLGSFDRGARRGAGVAPFTTDPPAGSVVADGSRVDVVPSGVPPRR